MDYSQWHSSQHDDEPRDQQRDLNVPGHSYHASIGPDGRWEPGDWSWTILEFDGTDNHEVAGNVAGGEQAAPILSPTAGPGGPVTIFLTYWLPTQYGMGLNAAQVAAALREAGWPDEAGTADRIARGEITGGDATDVLADDGDAGAALSCLALAIRKNAELFRELGPEGEPVGFDDPETCHVWIGLARDAAATHQIARHASQYGHPCQWSGTPASCHLDGPVSWQCPAGCYTSLEDIRRGRPVTTGRAGPASGTRTMVRAIAAREGWTDATVLDVLIGYLSDQQANAALRGYLEERAAG